MGPIELQQLYYELDSARPTRSAKRGTMASRLKAKLRDLGFRPTPFGVGNGKTGSWSTYRQVGTTCPLSCRHHPDNNATCYAHYGRTGIHSKRSGDESFTTRDFIATAMACMIGASWCDEPARLHTSGDFGSTLDLDYITGIAAVADIVRRRTAIRLSGTDAVTYPHDHVRTLEPIDARPYLKCPAQLPQSLSCIECTMCWTQPDHVVVFDPHGTQAKRARTNALSEAM